MYNTFLYGTAINDHRKVHLELPSARTYTKLQLGYDVPRDSNILIQLAANDDNSRNSAALVQKKPEVYNSFGPISFKSAFQRILARHPYPYYQGPLFTHLKTLSGDSIRSDDSNVDFLRSKITFIHPETQPCYKWSPLESGLNGWKCKENGNSAEEVSYVVTNDLGGNICGPSSLLDNLRLLYPCKYSKCIIECPCKICTDVWRRCREGCKTLRCLKCDYQCRDHKLNLQRTFNSHEHHFTLIASEENFFHFVTPYSGIPLSCERCSDDVLEHQILHLAFHLKCKFCRHEFRSFENSSVVTFSDFIKSEKEISEEEDSTCSICFKVCLDKEARKIHQNRSHGSHCCKDCNEVFTSRRKLQYHFSQNHKDAVDEKVFSTHNVKDYGFIECDRCNSYFNSKSSLYRHRREVHSMTEYNTDYIQKDSLTFKCTECDKSFWRRFDLQRHINAVHKRMTKFQCQVCGKAYPRKDTLIRHSKTIHGTGD